MNETAPAASEPSRPDSGDGSAAVLPRWLREAAAALALPADAVPMVLLLDLARDAAHGVARPAAPLTTFLVGLAAGRAGGSERDVVAASATLSRLLAHRAEPSAQPDA